MLRVYDVAFDERHALAKCPRHDEAFPPASCDAVDGDTVLLQRAGTRRNHAHVVARFAQAYRESAARPARPAGTGRINLTRDNDLHDTILSSTASS
jgi:hypothetical protein